MTLHIWSQAVLLGAWFGLLHAFDADHLATIGGLAVRDRTRAPTVYALRWALGHGAAIGLIALLVLGLGLTRAVDLSRYFELLVCLALFAIGAQALHAARCSARAPLGMHRHATTEIGATHLHFLAPWHQHTRGGRASVLMGLLHGGAGSAAVLALLPLTQFDSGIASALYLACFCLGVAGGALAFARLFALLAHRTAAAGARLAAAFQGGIGIVAIVSGALLLYEILHGGG
jgi:hypothetical protein